MKKKNPTQVRRTLFTERSTNFKKIQKSEFDFIKALWPEKYKILQKLSRLHQEVIILWGERSEPIGACIQMPIK